MNFKPLHDRVLVKRVNSDEKTAGGIIIPDTAQEKPMEGEVLEVGSGARDESGKLVPLDVKKGDKILFGKWSGTEVKIAQDGEILVTGGNIMNGYWNDPTATNSTLVEFIFVIRLSNLSQISIVCLSYSSKSCNVL